MESLIVVFDQSLRGIPTFSQLSEPASLLARKWRYATKRSNLVTHTCRFFLLLPNARKLRGNKYSTAAKEMLQSTGSRPRGVVPNQSDGELSL